MTSKVDMIAWFITELKLSHEDVARVINLYGDDEPEDYNAEQVEQMMLGHRKWPESAWEALRLVTSNEIANAQVAVEKLNKGYASTCIVSEKDLSHPLGRLRLFITCVLLRDNVPILIE